MLILVWYIMMSFLEGMLALIASSRMKHEQKPVILNVCAVRAFTGLWSTCQPAVGTLGTVLLCWVL